MISKESIPEQAELFLLGPKLVQSKRDIMYSTTSSFVEDKPVEIVRVEATHEVATSEGQTEAMEAEEEPVFVESDLEQYELFKKVIPAEEYADLCYAYVGDNVMGKIFERHHDFLEAGFVFVVIWEK
jgi:hypothetical protein